VEASPHSLIAVHSGDSWGSLVSSDLSPGAVKRGARLAEEKGRSAVPASPEDPLRVL
jgi:hypothetical protein